MIQKQLVFVLIIVFTFIPSLAISQTPDSNNTKQERTNLFELLPTFEECVKANICNEPESIESISKLPIKSEYFYNYLHGKISAQEVMLRSMCDSQSSASSLRDDDYSKFKFTRAPSKILLPLSKLVDQYTQKRSKDYQTIIENEPKRYSTDIRNKRSKLSDNFRRECSLALNTFFIDIPNGLIASVSTGDKDILFAESFNEIDRKYDILINRLYFNYFLDKLFLSTKQSCRGALSQEDTDFYKNEIVLLDKILRVFLEFKWSIDSCTFLDRDPEYHERLKQFYYNKTRL